MTKRGMTVYFSVWVLGRTFRTDKQESAHASFLFITFLILGICKETNNSKHEKVIVYGIAFHNGVWFKSTRN